MTKKNKNGFSLLELLIVIAIIVSLATISFLALNDQQAKARDAKRINDISRIKASLEFYYSDEGEFPVESLPIFLGTEQKIKLCSKAVGGFVANSTQCNEDSVYMTGIPKDPLVNQNYTYTGSVQGFDITFITEKKTIYGPPGVYHAHKTEINAAPGNR